ncbi:hypothetical protein LEP1GSC016_3132 [Leptospira borgpetersenii serovar Hardjo-bovis str. Sponselee]|uniref:Uncharacterized protein n=1 Tax=Leptospira borgpetersenii serovar Hardjo-bovis str. Sponselee TaxID=1303729 RepID=M6BNJ1_LEPBO|nr:hypothetical protein LEP1GSC016_3132 [Leptospira borgpetersenii serovar Hardjo-bovis str. Sponselee]
MFKKLEYCIFLKKADNSGFGAFCRNYYIFAKIISFILGNIFARPSRYLSLA